MSIRTQYDSDLEALKAALAEMGRSSADTHADNKAMRHILEKTGLIRCGVIHVADGSPRFAYQRMSLTMPLEH